MDIFLVTEKLPRDIASRGSPPFTDANPKTIVQRVPGSEGNRIYSIFGLSVTLTAQAGGFGGKSGFYEIMGLPIKSKTKSGYQAAFPGDSIDLSYATMNSRRGRVGKDIAHTLTTSSTQGYYFVYCFNLNPQPKITELARCITTRQDNGISKRKGEKSGIIFISAEPIAVLTPDREKVRQQGRRFKLPGEPMFTITVMDRHGVVYMGFIRKLIPLECWRLQGFTDEQFHKMVFIDKLNERIRHDQPLVEFAEQVAGTNNLIDMNSMAKLAAEENIPIGRNKAVQLAA